MRILIVEDDMLLVESLTAFLRQAGYEVDCESSGPGADAALSRTAYDLLILDIGLPGMDGFGVLYRLRQREQELPVLILTARDAVEDRVYGLNLGADDYVLKPFQLQELEARVRALLRRGLVGRGKKLSLGVLVLDLGGHRAWCDGAVLELTASEWRILEVLVRRAGKVVTKEQLRGACAAHEDLMSPNAVEVKISRLRAKLGATGMSIRTVRGFGYMLDEPVENRR
jgi:two-component system, OmpR family, response regulator